ncbi:MAG: asparagine synthase (glutamine-hydrolyzing) [Phycisphaerales bacterium]|nr:asparagine synthase (glutamine-hydrolyzing) [Phycisphaerales bacterium]
MCGIGGIRRVWNPDQREQALRTPHEQSISETWLDIIDASIKHRGPDGQGRFRDRAIRPDGCVVDIALVHRRLSIIDPTGGSQPMVSRLPDAGQRDQIANIQSPQGTDARDARSLALPEFPLVFHGSPNARVDYRPPSSPSSDLDCLAVVFNGCIYNHRELRGQLQQAGHVFTSDHSDTEVILHGWREWGDDLIPRLDGMYALAIWDRRWAELLIARDRFGEKPLYLADLSLQTLDGSRFSGFASTVPGLAQVAAKWSKPMKREEQDSAMSPFLALGWAHGSLPIAGIRDCPIDWWTVDARPWAYGSRDEYHPRLGRSGQAPPRIERPRPFANLRDVETHLFSAVADRMDADVPLGCFLSGGVDSSLVALAAMRARGSLHTFTVRMDHPTMDESAHAQRVAKIVGSTHHTIDAQMRPADDLSHLITQLGLPFGDSSLLPTLWISRAAREHVHVALGGDGGDDLFHGYQRQSAWRWRHWLGPIRLIPDSLLARSSSAEKLLRLKQALGNGRYSELLRIFPSRDLGKLSPSLQSLTEHSLDELDRRWNMTDAQLYLPHDLMRKVDTASMSVGLEVRSPLLARSLAGRALRTPVHRLRRGRRKGLLRSIARRHFPSDLIDRPKQGFAIPIGEWFRSDYGGLRTMLLDHLNSAEPFGSPSLGIDLNMAFIRQMLDEHLGTGPSGRVVRDHSQRLYMLLVLSIWAKWVSGLK